MARIRSFFKTTLLGGLVVLTPITVLLAIFKWAFLTIMAWIKPFTNMLMAKSDLREFLAAAIVLTIILGTCFVVGLLVRTRLGRWAYNLLESQVLSFVPGYGTIKEIVGHFLGAKKSPFSAVALVQPFCNETLATAFVTDQTDQKCSVFIPTGPNPTSGQIYHLDKAYVHHIDISVEEAMRSIIACGAGSAPLLKARKKGTAQTA